MEASLRRAPLLKEMDRLASEDKHCAACPGHCCTAVANSMQTTPLETLDVLNFLRASGRWTDELKLTLQANVAKFRLDQIPGNGRKNFLRRTYDCPFFAGSSLGCTLERTIKPYGCLGFNPTASKETQGDSCGSNQDLLAQREDVWATEAAENTKLKAQYSLWWEKLPLPLALLEAERQGM